MRTLVAKGIREDRGVRASYEAAREVLRDMVKSFRERAATESRRSAEAGDRRDGDAAEDADRQEEAYLAAAAAVSETLEGLADARDVPRP